MLIGESNVAIDPAIGGYGVADIYLGEFSPHSPLPGTQAGSQALAGHQGDSSSDSKKRRDEFVFFIEKKKRRRADFGCVFVTHDAFVGLLAARLT